MPSFIAHSTLSQRFRCGIGTKYCEREGDKEMAAAPMSGSLRFGCDHQQRAWLLASSAKPDCFSHELANEPAGPSADRQLPWSSPYLRGLPRQSPLSTDQVCLTTSAASIARPYTDSAAIMTTPGRPPGARQVGASRQTSGIRTSRRGYPQLQLHALDKQTG